MYAKYTKEILEEAAKKSINITQVLDNLGLKRTGGSHSHIKKRMKHFDVDTSHFSGRVSRKGISPVNKHTEKSFLKEVLCEGGKKWSSSGIKKKLVEFGLKKDECEICGLTTTWNKKELIMQLNHKNGNHFDNRIENLEIICPNCHTQTETFSCKKRL